MQKPARGFTIVELLIVIVVIAVLAAITVIAYNGIQQRANNTAIIQAVGQTIKSIQAYKAQEGDYPVNSTYACITSSSGCVEANGTSRTANATLDVNIAKVSTLPRNVPNTTSLANGIIYNHAADRQYNGQLRPVLLMYFLNGLAQKCGVNDVMTAWGTPGQEASTASTGYTASNASVGKTICFVSVP